MNRIRLKPVLIISGLIAVIALCAVYARFDPASSEIPFPKCPSRLVTGLDCPGCGSQRALHAMLNGDFAAMFRYNAIFFPALLMVAALGVAELLKGKYPRFHSALNSTASMITVLTVFILWTVIRNIFL